MLGRRPDGLHELDSVVVFTCLGDRLRFEAAERLELIVGGPDAGGVPGGDGNLVVKAARALAAAAGRGAGVRIVLEKHLPAAAGIGGGSADAAAALRGLSRLWRLDLPARELEVLGASLGADVPACLRSRPLRMRGIGERLEDLRLPGPLHLLLANPRVPLPTGPVFRGLDASPAPRRAPPVAAAAVRWMTSGRNDLEAAAVRLEPAVGEVLDRLRGLPGVRLARMSGSGATCFGWFGDAAGARRAADILADARPGWWIRPVVAGGRP